MGDHPQNFIVAELCFCRFVIYRPIWPTFLAKWDIFYTNMVVFGLVEITERVLGYFVSELSFSSLPFHNKYTTGTTNSDNSGAVIIPPIIGAAMHCMTSDPVP